EGVLRGLVAVDHPALGQSSLGLRKPLAVIPRQDLDAFTGLGGERVDEPRAMQKHSDYHGVRHRYSVGGLQAEAAARRPRLEAYRSRWGWTRSTRSTRVRTCRVGYHSPAPIRTWPMEPGGVIIPSRGSTQDEACDRAWRGAPITCSRLCRPPRRAPIPRLHAIPSPPAPGPARRSPR